jgi:transposase-like protein
VSDDEQLRLLREIARWTREAALPSARERVSRLLDSDAKKRVYEAIADGSANVTAVEKAAGVNHNVFTPWLRAWENEGIAEPATGASKALFTLTELGIEPPPERARRARKSASS